MRVLGTSRWLIGILMWLPVAALSQSPAVASQAGMPQAGISDACTEQTTSDLCLLIELGRLEILRWPDFSDYRREAREFYEPTHYALAWTAENLPTPAARAVIRLLQDSASKGLEPEDYDGPLWESRMADLTSYSHPSPANLASFDLAVTISAMRYLAALHNGRVNPQHLQFRADLDGQQYSLPQLLRTRVADSRDVDRVVEQLEPAYAGYFRARSALQHYLLLARDGEGTPLPVFSRPVKPGVRYSGAQALAQRLQRLGDLPTTSLNALKSDSYEGALVEAVRHFQERHGLPGDGVIDRETFNQIVTQFSQRVTQLQLTLERWRWLPRNLPQRTIVVNVPEFRLRGLENHRVSISMKVVVGRKFPEHQTPVFQEQLRYLVFRPYWNVPSSIVRKELIPEIQKNPAYLDKHQFEVVNLNGEVLNLNGPALIAGLLSGKLGIRQRPGVDNSLGLIKFVFPNNFDVYLHGTPQQALFARSSRAFSHGCIRIEDPAALAEWVLQDDPSWTRDRILSAMNANNSMRVDLPQPIPVLVLYGTALVAANGDVQFFTDIYGYDARLQQTLAKGYPYPA